MFAAASCQTAKNYVVYFPKEIPWSKTYYYQPGQEKNPKAKNATACCKAARKDNASTWEYESFPNDGVHYCTYFESLPSSACLLGPDCVKNAIWTMLSGPKKKVMAIRKCSTCPFDFDSGRRSIALDAVTSNDNLTNPVLQRYGRIP